MLSGADAAAWMALQVTPDLVHKGKVAWGHDLKRLSESCAQHKKDFADPEFTFDLQVTEGAQP